ncbi:MAG: hypothetical protein EB122_06085, partial [Actinobacteria bacterium]|nr:hypothetical protein [Actinomycetota bacterium]NDF94100.1 hypothetical protein [Actinomycetota bacterium]
DTYKYQGFFVYPKFSFQQEKITFDFTDCEFTVVDGVRSRMKRKARRLAIGLEFWQQMKAFGNFVPVAATPATVKAGHTPILLDWDYLHAKYKGQSGKVDWKVVVPSDARLVGFYAPAVVKNSPHSTAVRLWQEF